MSTPGRPKCEYRSAQHEGIPITPVHPARCGHEPAPRANRAAEDLRPEPVPSEALLRGRRLVEITHNGEVYRLRATRLGKLILTK